MRFSVYAENLPWRVRLALFRGAQIVSSAYVHEGIMVITVAVKWRGAPIWWQEWRAPADQSFYGFREGSGPQLEAQP